MKTSFLLFCGAIVFVACSSSFDGTEINGVGEASLIDDSLKVVKTNAEWEKQLSPLEYNVTRERGTERAFTGRYWDNKKDGDYFCVCCDHLLFSSKTKFKSGTGWPSFYDIKTSESIMIQEDLSHGMIRKEETIKIKVPPGVEEGNYMTVNGQGNEDINGNPGDLIVVFSEDSHEYFVRDGEHVILELNISYPTAVLGGKVEIPVLGGKAGLKIPSGIQSGQVLRMKGKGFPMLRGRSNGDQLVKVQLFTPTKISKNVKKKLFEILSKDDRFHKDRCIVDFNMASSGISYNKRSFMSVELTLFQKEPFLK